MNTFNKVLVLGLAVIAMAGPAYPQNRDIIQLQKDMIELRNTMNQLQSSVDQKNTAVLSLVEKIFDQVNGLTGNMQKLSQAVDAVNSHTDKSSADLKTQMNGFGSKITELSDTVAALRSQMGSVSQQINTMKSAAEPLPNLDETWRTAYLDLTSGNYDLALQEFAEFIAKYPNDPRAPRAQIYKAQSLFEMKKFDQAVIEYDTFLQKYPENDDTKTALYKKGLAQVEINDPKAQATLQSVVAKYPNSVEATSAKQTLQKLAARGKRGPGV